LGDAPAGRFLEGVVNIVERTAAESGPVTGTIRRLGEPVQFEPELLQQLKAAGVLPGAVASLSAEGSYVLVQVEGFGDGLELPAEVAQHVYVAA
jgi:DtxR family Mn-dependent transcriptional regulator